MVARALLALTLLSLCVAACRSQAPSGKTLAGIKANKVIRWGADLQGGEPYVYEDPADRSHLIGFEVDIMDAIARRLGVRAEMVQNDWQNLVPSLERGDFDVIMNGLEDTPERRDRILLSDPYFVYAETLTVRADSKILSVFELGGKKVGTLSASVSDDILRMMPSIDRKPYDGNEGPYKDLELGRIDGVLLDDIIAARYGCTPEHPQLKCLPYDVARGTYVIGMRKGDDELKHALDGALADMRHDGELERILRKWNLWDQRQVEQVPLGAAPPSAHRSFDWPMAKQFLWASTVTLEISVLAFLLAVIVGMGLAVARVYGGRGASAASRVYVELLRGTPVLLQLYVLYYVLGEYYTLGPMTAAILGLGLNYGAYEAEVYRGALLAISRGQTEASKALGMSPVQTLRYVLLPQALRLALPPMTNDFVSLLKDSSLVSVITVVELTKRMTIASVDLRGWIIPGIACAALYLAMSFPLSELARRLERRLARDQRPQAL